MTWLDESAGWRARTRRWLPKEVEPLRVRVWLRSELAWDAYNGITIEGALQAVVVTRESGMLPDDAFAGAPRDFFADVPIPIEDATIAGTCIACASWAVPACGFGTVRAIRRKARVELLPVPRGSGLVTIAGGPYKSTDISIDAIVTPYVDFYVRGDRMKLIDLARDMGSLGRARGGGLGAVFGIEVDRDVQDRSLVYKGVPQRSIPVASEIEARSRFLPGTFDVREVQARAPYWVRSGPRALCAVPNMDPMDWSRRCAA